MGFLNTDSMPRLVEALTDANNIKITGNAKGTKVGAVVNKIVEKADEVTKAVEQEVLNSGYSFKVGTGDIDVSSDVQDGIGEVGIKGMTYQNLLGKYFIGSGSNDYISIESEKIKFNKPQTGSNISIRYPDALVQPSKTYTLMFYVYKNTLQREDDSLVNVAKFNIVSYNTGVCHIPKNTTGLIKAVLHQPSTVTGDGKPYLEVYGSCFGEIEISYPILLEGNHANDNDLPLCLEGIVGVGDKSKNLFNPNNLKQTVLDLGKKGEECIEKNSNTRCSIRSIPCKPNTKYTFKSDKAIYIALGSIDSDNIALGDSSWRMAKNGFTYTTPSNAVELAMNFQNESSTNIALDDVRAINIQLQEGENADTYQPYGTHKIEILSNGVNLCNKNNFVSGTLTNDGEFIAGSESSYNVEVKYVPISGTKKIRVLYTVGTDQDHNQITFYDSNKRFIKSYWDRADKLIDTPSNARYIRFRFKKEDTDIMVCESDVKIPYEPYQEDKTQILLDEPLMSLPDGLCDEITRDGKLIRRVGKVVLDGTQGMFKSTVMSSDGSYRYGYRATDGAIKSSTNLICDKLVVKTPQTHNSIFQTAIDDYTCCGLYLATKDYSEVVDYKQWLSQNPVTVYYELKTPVITDIAPSTLRIFKDGHITFNTLVAPESTHLVQLNKSAQIERSIREVQGLDARVERLEGFYDDMILETAHKLSTLDFDFSLIRKGE